MDSKFKNQSPTVEHRTRKLIGLLYVLRSLYVFIEELVYQNFNSSFQSTLIKNCERGKPFIMLVHATTHEDLTRKKFVAVYGNKDIVCDYIGEYHQRDDKPFGAKYVRIGCYGISDSDPAVEQLNALVKQKIAKIKVLLDKVMVCERKIRNLSIQEKWNARNDQ